MPKRQNPFNGLLIVDKPGRFDDERNGRGDFLTSHDVVQRARRWSGQRRIGHTGTLDPMASGVLVLCLGQATRLVEYYQGHDKTYRAEVVLGRATDSYDAMGETVAESAVPPLDAAQIERSLDQFRGPIQQIPPIFSAIKREGESVHRKARRGETVELAPRPVAIHELTLLEFLPQPQPRVHLRIVCSAGTYIRSLAHDLGQALGTHAFLDALRREQAGAFNLNAAHRMASIERAAADERLGELLLPPGCGLELPTLRLEDEAALHLSQGKRVALTQPPSEGVLDPDNPLAQAVGDNDKFLGVARYLGDDTWKAEKWFSQ